MYEQSTLMNVKCSSFASKSSSWSDGSYVFRTDLFHFNAMINEDRICCARDAEGVSNVVVGRVLFILIDNHIKYLS